MNPVLDAKTGDSLEVTQIARQECRVMPETDGSDLEILSANSDALSSQLVILVDGDLIEANDLPAVEEADQLDESIRPPLVGTRRCLGW